MCIVTMETTMCHSSTALYSTAHSCMFDSSHGGGLSSCCVETFEHFCRTFLSLYVCILYKSNILTIRRKIKLNTTIKTLGNSDTNQKVCCQVKKVEIYFGIRITSEKDDE